MRGGPAQGEAGERRKAKQREVEQSAAERCEADRDEADGREVEHVREAESVAPGERREAVVCAWWPDPHSGGGNIAL